MFFFSLVQCSIETFRNFEMLIQWPLWCGRFDSPLKKNLFLSLQYWDNDRHGLEILSVLSSCHQTFALAICQRFLVLHSLRSFNRIKRNNYNRKCFSFKQYKRRLYCDLTRKFSWNSAVYILSQLVILLRLFALILVRVVNEILASGGIQIAFVLTKVRHQKIRLHMYSREISMKVFGIHK